MLYIKLKDGSIYKFKKNEFTEYEIKKDFVVVYNKDAWIGVFALSEFVALYIE